jgi:V-type H+-transporting ATPase subunit E
MAEDEATKELRKMVAFIMQEAAEKSREIHVKADEEFNIEKAKLVYQETTAIEQQFERKIKQTEIRRKMYVFRRFDPGLL